MFSTLLKEAWNNLLSHKLRSLLSVLGIFWGTFAVSMLMSLGEGFYDYNAEALQPFLHNIFWVQLVQTTQPYQGFPPGQEPYLSYSQMQELTKVLPDVSNITASITKPNVTFTTSQKSDISYLRGSDPNYFDIFSVKAIGRRITDKDIQERAPVTFLSYYLKQQLFPNSDPIGQAISINNFYFKVIGYAKKPQGFFGGINNEGAIIPYSVFAQLYLDQVYNFVISLKPGSNSDIFEKQLKAYLAHQLHYDPSDTGAIQIFNISKMAKTLRGILLASQLFLIFCGVMTLMVGGISVANMMTLLVKERTREIGLKMALGAQPHWIMSGIMMETLILVFIGGILALALAIFGIGAMNHMTLPTWMGHPHLSGGQFLIVFGFLLMTAIISGYFPARYASRLAPVAALNDRGE